MHLSPGDVQQLSPALRYLETFPQFIVYSLFLSTTRAEKWDKVPVNPSTNVELPWTTPGNWMTYQAAMAAAASARTRFPGVEFRVGFVITPETKLFCLDVDGALLKGVSCPGCFSEETVSLLKTAGLQRSLDVPNPTCASCKGNGVDRQWHPLAGKLRAALLGAGFEFSVSYEGFHLWGCYQGPEPAHANVKVVEGVKPQLRSADEGIRARLKIRPWPDCSARSEGSPGERYGPYGDSSEEGRGHSASHSIDPSGRGYNPHRHRYPLEREEYPRSPRC